jgi:shikimate kinase/3-dehydroquinate synthase
MAKVSAGAAAPAGAAGASPRARKLVLVGFMGAGKSRAARRAAERLGIDALDSDLLLERSLGEPIERFFEREGESAFREREEALVLELLDREDAAVVALGGGAVKSERVCERLARHVCAYMEVDVELAWERVERSDRPLARDRAGFAELHGERLKLYEAVARVVVPAAEEAGLDAALDAALALARADVPDTVGMAWASASTPAGGYPVFVGDGALQATGALWSLGGRCFAVADERAHALHGERFEAGLDSEGGPSLAGAILVPPGEKEKTVTGAERILRLLAEAGMQRSDALAALGGGVVGDLAGFCAAVYQRGVPVVHVPTTLVAQVDSAYGGKTGVDLPEAKNYVGCFHQPAAVFTDPTVLSTLPAEELRAGFAEVVKTALIAGGELWTEACSLEPLERSLGRDAEAVERMIEGCLRTKLRIVAADERDLGGRAALNLGHTFAHALEAATAYERFRHGEAVALGLLVALRLSERELGLDPSVRDQALEVLARHGLPTAYSGPPLDELLGFAARDKKRRGGERNLVLLRAPGDVAIDCEVPDALIADAVDEIRERS